MSDHPQVQQLQQQQMMQRQMLMQQQQMQMQQMQVYFFVQNGSFMHAAHISRLIVLAGTGDDEQPTAGANDAAANADAAAANDAAAGDADAAARPAKKPGAGGHEKKGYV